MVLIGRCTENGHVAAALLTVTVGRAASGGVLLAGADALAKYLTSTAGRRALSRSGHGEDVQVLETGILSGQLMLHIKDTVAGEYWRAIIGIKGRLVTVSASGAQDAPLTSQAGRKLVSQTVAALIKANPTTVR